MRKFVKYLPYRVLVCCFVFLFISCNNDELNEDKIEVTDVEEIAEIKSIKFIPSFELPETFKEQIVNSFDREAVVLPIVQDVKALDLNVLQKQVLSTYFESHASVIESSGGLTTYALPIKKYSAYGVALKEGSFIKQANSKACPDRDPFEALVINFNGNSSFGDTGMTHVSISPGVSLGQFYVTFNHSNGTSHTILTTSDGTQISTSGTGNGNLGSVISSIWRGIKSFFNGLINLFNAKKCKCKANGISLVIEKQVELSSIEFGNCCDNTSDGGYAMLNALEDVEFEYYFPLPDSLFEKQAAATKKLGINSDDSLDCCALDEVDISTADASIKQDYFKCSCTGDNPLGVASYLELSPDLSFWLAKPKNKSTRDAICTFVIENHFSTQAIAFAKAAVVVLENGGEVDFENRLIYDSTLDQDYLSLMAKKEKEIFDSLTNYQKTQYLMSAQQAWKYAEIHYLESFYNGNGDAVRHAFWNALATVRLGEALTKKLTDAHESDPFEADYPNQYKERDMDLFNNNVGREIASKSGRLFQLIEEALKSGNLRKLSNLAPNRRATDTSQLIPTN
jgi:hypothetical protein